MATCMEEVDMKGVSFQSDTLWENDPFDLFSFISIY